MTHLIVPKDLLDSIISHCHEVYPNEACGILAGKEGFVQKVYKMNNTGNSPVSYMMDPKEQFTVMKEMRKEGLDLTAIYHSHPYLDAYPSPRDIQLAFYPDTVYVIVSLLNNEPIIRAFTIKEGNIEEVEIKVIVK
jgi:proteasome lid subunit RPN8/RPN11